MRSCFGSFIMAATAAFAAADMALAVVELATMRERWVLKIQSRKELQTRSHGLHAAVMLFPCVGNKHQKQ
jgi:hypothetical protein